jgi:steroid delta-isomerase-like uncharacterized protein
MDRPAIHTLVRRWLDEAVAQGIDDVFDELLTEDVIDRSGGGGSRGRESFKARSRFVRAALADRSATLDELLVDGDRIAWRWTLAATHVGPLLDVPATGRRVTLSGVNFQRIEGGRVAEHWTVADFAGLLRQLK